MNRFEMLSTGRLDEQGKDTEGFDPNAGSVLLASDSLQSRFDNGQSDALEYNGRSEETKEMRFLNFAHDMLKQGYKIDVNLEAKFDADHYLEHGYQT